MRAFRSGLSLALAATLALGACSAAPDNDGLVLASARTGSSCTFMAGASTGRACVNVNAAWRENDQG